MGQQTIIKAKQEINTNVRKANYDKYPATVTDGMIFTGWDAILKEIRNRINTSSENTRCLIVVECYQGVLYDELKEAFLSLEPALFVDTKELFRPDHEIQQLTHRFLTDDRLFGYKADFLSYTDFLDPKITTRVQGVIKAQAGVTVVYGHGATVVTGMEADVLIYADMARWEIQMRSRKKLVCGLGVNNSDEAPSLHYKRGYFVDWHICDKLKKQLMDCVDYWLDTHIANDPKMIDADTMKRGLIKTAHKPFRVVPFFDPAPWGGQWMKEVCALDKKQANYGWCFDCVPEENSLYLKVNDIRFEMPSNNLVFYQTRNLLGAPVEARFGQDFPIRFDFLDTMGGGHLSLQVHPTTQYIRDTFGMQYTQDESYYLLDADEDATVYLGLKTGVNPEEMIAALEEAQQTGGTFDAEKYVNKWDAKAHDHYLIPAGTIHCSGSGAMVLEISATPSIFTFKLWDWGRLGLDGQPRPINIGHGSKVIQWDRQTEFVKEQLINAVTPVASGEGWREERTGLHENEFIETRRHWFTDKVEHNTHNGVQVINVIKGDELIVESPDNHFEPFVVHYAETFIVPACVGRYTIRPYGASEGNYCGTLKAFIRFKE